jgi:GTP-binding protein
VSKRVGLARVILLGRPNVGKSTLFNRLLGKKVAMTDAEPHTTRDILAETCRAGDYRFELIDAAGFLVSPEDTLAQSIKRGLDAAAATADVVVLVFDGREGVLPLDRELADFVRRLKKPVLPVVNKIDSPSLGGAVADFYELGFEADPVAVSAANGFNCAELIEGIVARLGAAAAGEEREEDARPGVAIVGRPNVGKSSLLNRLAGADRVVVHETPGTTRDAVDVEIEFDGRDFLFVDTAGIRRRTRAKERLEAWSLGKAFAAVRRASVVVLVVDGAEGPTSQDAKIAGYADRHGRSLVIFVNKTDLLDEAEMGAGVEARIRDVRSELAFASYAAVLTGSALEGAGTEYLFPAIIEAEESWRRRVGTGELNRALRGAMDRGRFKAGGKEVALLYAAQVDSGPPTFQLFLNVSKPPPPAFRRFVENRLREAFPFTGTPLRIAFRLRAKRGNKK